MVGGRQGGDGGHRRHSYGACVEGRDTDVCCRRVVNETLIVGGRNGVGDSGSWGGWSSTGERGGVESGGGGKVSEVGVTGRRGRDWDESGRSGSLKRGQ